MQVSCLPLRAATDASSTPAENDFLHLLQVTGAGTSAGLLLPHLSSRPTAPTLSASSSPPLLRRRRRFHRAPFASLPASTLSRPSSGHTTILTSTRRLVSTTTTRTRRCPSSAATLPLLRRSSPPLSRPSSRLRPQLTPVPRRPSSRSPHLTPSAHRTPSAISTPFLTAPRPPPSLSTYPQHPISPLSTACIHLFPRVPPFSPSRRRISKYARPRRRPATFGTASLWRRARSHLAAACCATSIFVWSSTALKWSIRVAQREE